MDKSLCKLTLVCPPAGAERIIEVMLANEPAVAGFTTWIAEGHGFGFSSATVSERVRGRVKRCVIVAVVKLLDVDDLLKSIESKAGLPHLTFWTEPVTGFGQMQGSQFLRSKIPPPGSIEAERKS